MTAGDLRHYQQQGVRSILRELSTRRSTVWVCPTGGGKSRVFCEVARRLGGRVLVLADRVALVEQAAGNFATHAPGVEVECATVQMASRPRWLREQAPDRFDLIVIDEADLAIAPSYRRVVDHFPGARIVGVTATPDRHDGKPLGTLFESVAGVVHMADLIRGGYLVRIRSMLTRIESVTLDEAGIEKGDFNREALGRILAAERPLHEVARVTLDNAGERPTIVFAASIAHAEALCEVFRRYRPGCARVVHSQQEEDDGEIRDAFARREFQFLINVAMLTRGVDLPLTACIAMAAPTMSRPRYAQMVGRGTRPADGKRDLLVLDFVGNGETHKLASVMDVLGGKLDEETRERARERMEERPGSDVLDEVDGAAAELAADPALRERVRAVVTARLVEVESEPEITDEMWRTMSNRQIGITVKRDGKWVALRRPSKYPSPGKSSEYLRRQAIEQWNRLTPEQRVNSVNKMLSAHSKDEQASRARFTWKKKSKKDQLTHIKKMREAVDEGRRKLAAAAAMASRSKEYRKAIGMKSAATAASKRTREQRYEMGRRLNAKIAPAQRREIARLGGLAVAKTLTADQRKARAKKAAAARRAKKDTNA